jgi:hypothetical protein
VVPFVDGRGMQTNGLIVGAVSETLSISDEELWVETPSNDRASDDVIVAIGICALRYIKELPSFAREAGSASLVAHKKLWASYIPI